MSDKALTPGVRSVMVRDWPPPFLVAPFCLKGCQQLLWMPGCHRLDAFFPCTEVWKKVWRCFCSTWAAGLEHVTYRERSRTAQLLFCTETQPSLLSCPIRVLGIEWRGEFECTHVPKCTVRGRRPESVKLRSLQSH